MLKLGAKREHHLMLISQRRALEGLLMPRCLPFSTGILPPIIKKSGIGDSYILLHV